MVKGDGVKWDSGRLKKEYIDFFKKHGHKEIPNASLIPENDPTVLFTTAGMHPLVPFLIGEKHASGKRLVNVQRCIRTGDIEEVGDDVHLTFFEMLGNWSLGDYFKKESIEMSYEFLIKVLGIDAKKINITVFEGDKNAPRDEESAKVWVEMGIPRERIFYLPKKCNWWGPAGEAGPCGPDTEIFVDMGKQKCSSKCDPSCSCGKYVEIWNNVFMQYNKRKDGKFEPLKQKNVDTGMGVERTTAMLSGKKNVFEIEQFAPLISELKKISKNYNERSGRIIADHLTAAVFILGDEKGITPSNVGQGYVLRRLIRGAIRHGEVIGLEGKMCVKIAREIIKIRGKDYDVLRVNEKKIMTELEKEEDKFRDALHKGMKEFNKLSGEMISGYDAFLLFSSFGFPLEMTRELAGEKGMKVDVKGFEEEFRKHQEISRTGAEKKFKSGLADASEETTKLHSATHLLHAALRKVLGEKVEQRGSNITPERLRFDFNLDRKMTEDEIKKVENMVNKWVNEGVKVVREEMSVAEAKKKGAIGLFDEKYGEKISVYTFGDVSKEICTGPHVKNTSELGRFKILKEESSAAGIRRIKAILL